MGVKKLDAEGLVEAHENCISTRSDDVRDFINWLESNAIDPEALLDEAGNGGDVWQEAYGGEHVAYTSAITAGFEWGFRARQLQELFS